jgi:hypothetical protein
MSRKDAAAMQRAALLRCHLLGWVLLDGQVELEEASAESAAIRWQEPDGDQNTLSLVTLPFGPMFFVRLLA